MNTIIFVHLLNDHSGSPKVLKDTIAAVLPHMNRAKLYLGSSGDGFLSSCDIPITRYWYKRMSKRILTLFTYLLSQAILSCKLLTDRTIDKNAIIYVNTLLPFGAAFYGRLTGRKVIYHVHEISISPSPLRYFLVAIAKWTADMTLYVSDTHIQSLPIQKVPARRVYNSLDNDFIVRARKSTYAHRHDGIFNILMVASLRDYKGIPELLALAASLHSQEAIRFCLLVNDDQDAIELYFSDGNHQKNLAVHSRTIDTASFYSQASLVLNLSRIDQCIETFGLTVLEAMAFGIPVIVPPVGGPAELVQEGVHGFHVDSYNQELLREKVLLLHSDAQLCKRMSTSCRSRAAQYSHDNFAANILSAIEHVRGKG